MKAPVLRDRAQRILVTVAALTVAGARILFPEIRIDAFTAALLVVAVLPWLGSIIKTVELPGGLKFELQEIRMQALEARGAAESAALQAGAALASATAASPRAEARASGFPGLAAEYNRIRETMERSPARTSAMTGVIGQMMALAVQTDALDVDGALRSGDRGMRLAAYVYLYAKPDQRWLAILVSTLTEVEDKPFNEYWAIRSIGNLAALQEGGRLPTGIRRKLQGYFRSLSISTDRHFELSRILSTSCGRTPTDDPRAD